MDIGHHQAENCPFCQIVAGKTDPITQPEDVFWQTETITAFIASHWWPRNPGHVLIIPNQHLENLYVIPPEVGAAIFEATRQVAIALKQVYTCDGTSVRQHNERAGNQEIFHYHMHVFPRYKHDFLYGLTYFRRLSSQSRRAEYTASLRDYFHAL